MAKARALDKRRRSIKNIRKITRTMELIATARFKRAMDRATEAGAYTTRITQLVKDLARSGVEIHHPLLEGRHPVRRAKLLVLTANRGLCGGYNASVLRLAQLRLQRLRERVEHVDLEVSGKRGIAAFKFRNMPMNQTFMQFEDRPEFGDVELLANNYLEQYEAKEIDRLDVVYTRFVSMSSQRAVVETILPLADVEGLDEVLQEDDTATVPFEFLPSAESILDDVVPMSVKVKLFKCFLDAAVSEQVSRMIAMKNATENADEIISNLSMTYNRARQGQITAELLEVIGGAEALKN